MAATTISTEIVALMNAEIVLVDDSLICIRKDILLCGIHINTTKWLCSSHTDAHHSRQHKNNNHRQEPRNTATRTSLHTVYSTVMALTCTKGVGLGSSQILPFPYSHITLTFPPQAEATIRAATVATENKNRIVTSSLAQIQVWGGL